jgi:transposase
MMRKRYTPTFKAPVVQKLLKEEKTLAQLAAEHGVHPSQLIKWRSTALQGLPSLFARQDSMLGCFVSTLPLCGMLDPAVLIFLI